jgi:pantoate--beta-alanine ligase
MKIINELDVFRGWRAEAGKAVESIGFVPTMGALHAGHLSLVERARAENETVVVSIFVNPTQFDEKDDYHHYSRDIERDAAQLRETETDILFTPESAQLYPDSYRYRVVENELATVMEGARRSGHFDGVLTVVLKLLSLVQPHRAYFGDKDHQQFRLIKGMVNAFFLPTEIVACPTIREPDGLAYSSRNRRLSASARAKAPELYRLLSSQATAEEVEKELVATGFEVEYVCDRDGRRFGAVRLEETRLIDNVQVY